MHDLMQAACVASPPVRDSVGLVHELGGLL